MKNNYKTTRVMRRIERMGLDFEEFRSFSDFHSLAICARKYDNKEQFLGNYRSYVYNQHGEDKIYSGDSY